ncbi:glycosyltransferase family 2 protein [Longitalea luteola]|uniref:glycosyltransferase family 2 protein n=1 Tax=Longitalea luteola TaxID=2812563 RepID=UPI001A97C1FA|nr:glycosyltransferase family 2 protein [Longitalea luteola]
MAAISVIIPSYNRATIVGETIENMLSQSLPPDEIIVVDDGSTDNSVEVVASFGDKVKLIRQTNQGPGAARNAGLKAAKGQFIQFMDSDDLASRNKLEIQFNALNKTGADFAYSPWVHCLIKNKTIQFTDAVLQADPVPATRPMLEWFLAGWSLVFQNCLFRRSILDKAGIYRTDLMPSEDSEYFVRILLAGAQPVHTPGCIVFYREHDLHKITASGTSEKHRADDWTNFLTITGDQLQDHLKGIKSATRIALAASVQQHLDFCAKRNLKGLPSNHPYIQLLSQTNKTLIKAWILYKKIRRKMKGSPDNHVAFGARTSGEAYTKLVTEMGYQYVSGR